jgi:hypothetical protein
MNLTRRTVLLFEAEAFNLDEVDSWVRENWVAGIDAAYRTFEATRLHRLRDEVGRAQERGVGR